MMNKTQKEALKKLTGRIDVLRRQNIKLLETLKSLCNMIERYKDNELSQEPLVQYFHALDTINKVRGD